MGLLIYLLTVVSRSSVTESKLVHSSMLGPSWVFIPDAEGQCRYKGLTITAVYLIALLTSNYGAPGSVSGRIPAYHNETKSILLPDNETIVTMNIAVKNQSPVMGTVSNVIQSPAVVDQMVSAVSKALEVEDAKEMLAIEHSIRTAFNKIGSNKQSNESSPSHTKQDANKPQKQTTITEYPLEESEEREVY